jgi:hypothetical protein
VRDPAADRGASPRRSVVIRVRRRAGANQGWLAPRLPFEQHWIADRSKTKRRNVTNSGSADLSLTTGVGILTSVLDRLGSSQLVTRSALLDLLTIDQLDAIGSALAVVRQPALVSLTVTGALELLPPPFDSHLIRAFILGLCQAGCLPTGSPD